MNPQKLELVTNQDGNGGGVCIAQGVNKASGFAIEPCGPLCGPMPVLVTYGDGAEGRKITVFDSRPFFAAQPFSFIRVETLPNPLVAYPGAFPDVNTLPTPGRPIGGNYKLNLYEPGDSVGTSQYGRDQASGYSPPVSVTGVWVIPVHDPATGTALGLPVSHQFDKLQYQPYYANPNGPRGGLIVGSTDGSNNWIRIQENWEYLIFHFRRGPNAAAVGMITLYTLDSGGLIRPTETIDYANFCDTDNLAYQAGAGTSSYLTLVRPVIAGNTFLAMTATEGTIAGSSAVNVNVEALVRGRDA